VKALAVSDNGLVGSFVAPATAGPHPALITFGGSEGGLATGASLAAYYASLGYSCLGLAYFGAKGLPVSLDKVPLEYFATALAWLKTRPEVDATRIGVMGGSRGGELALLLGSIYPDFKIVVANLPSGYVWPGLSGDAAWTLGGKDVVAVPDSNAQPITVTAADGEDEYISTDSFLADLKAASPAALAAATIPVEKSAAAFLMLAGADDQLWPSCMMSKVAADRLSGHTVDYECYPSAGHNIFEPNLPTTQANTTYIDGLLFALGGTPAGIAHASRDADTRIRHFLRDHL
jgi:dienelactone hydrolase